MIKRNKNNYYLIQNIELHVHYCRVNLRSQLSVRFTNLHTPLKYYVQYLENCSVIWIITEKISIFDSTAYMSIYCICQCILSQTIVLSVLRFTDSEYTFGIFKHTLCECLSMTCGRSVVFFGYSDFPHQ
jgi:hypothetical protein